jgi:hypothetical protein
VASRASITNAIGLDEKHMKLLLQCGAIDENTPHKDKIMRADQSSDYCDDQSAPAVEAGIVAKDDQE